MAAEAGHHATRCYIAQDGSFHLNGASFFSAETTDIKTILAALGSVTPTTYTQTYTTVAATVPNATYAAPSVTSVAVATTATTQTTPYGFAAQAQGDALVACANANKVDIAATNTQLAALAADVLALKKVIGQLIDDLQSYGLAG